jgi:hypothetical protein
LEGGQFNGLPLVCVLASYRVAGGYRKFDRMGVWKLRV